LDVLWSFIKTHLRKKTLVFVATRKQVRFILATFAQLRPVNTIVIIVIVIVVVIVIVIVNAIVFDIDIWLCRVCRCLACKVVALKSNACKPMSIFVSDGKL
jgi:hypothetical protein